MKKLVIVVVVLVIAGVLWWANRPQPDASLPTAVVTDVNTTTELPDNTVATKIVNTKQVDNQNVKIAFKGFGPGKSHVGSFGAINSQLSLVSGVLTGQVDIDMNTLQAPDSEKLQNHLKSADFFDTAKYPKASFKITSMTNTNVTGAMNIHGVTKSVTLPIKLADSVYTSTFNINMKDFGIDQKFANEVIELTITVPVK